MSDTATLPRPKTEVETRGQIVIEFADEHNCNHMWHPTKEVYRGRWLRANIPSGCVDQDGKIDALGDIPGIRIAIDPSRRRAVIFDPLSKPEYAEHCKRLAKACQVIDGTAVIRGVEFAPLKSVVRENMSDTEIKTWLYWMRRKLMTTDFVKVDGQYVEKASPQIIEISGQVPTLEEIEKLPGKTRTETFNSSSRARKFREDPEVVERVA